MRSLSPPPPSRPPCPYSRFSSSPPPYSLHIERRPYTKAQTTTTTLHHNHHPRDQQHQQQEHGSLHAGPSMQDLRMHFEQLHLQHCRQQQQQQPILPLRLHSNIPPALGLLPNHPYCSNNILQFPSSSPYNSRDTRYNTGNGQQPQSHHLHPMSAMMVVDITNLQGLVLYTLYFLHRLRFFRRWRDTHRTALSYRRRRRSPAAISSLPSALEFTSSAPPSSSLLSADTFGFGGARANAVALDQEDSGLLETAAAVAVDRSTAIFEPGAAVISTGVGETEPHTTTKYGDTPSLFSNSPSSSSSTFGSSFSSPSFTSPSSFTSVLPSVSSLSLTTMLPYIFSSSASTTTTTTTIPPSPSSTTLSTESHLLLTNTTTAIQTPSPSPSHSINTHLPPEILVQIFRHLAAAHHTRTLIRCTLVCHSWYSLVGPLVWKAPRVLWSQHWSRFHPITAMSTTGRSSSASASASASAFSTAVTSASSFSTTTTIPRQPGLSLAESQNYGHIDNHYGDGEHGTRSGSSNLVPDNSSLDPIAGGRGNGNPLSLQLQLQQILLQQTQQRQLAWLHLWQTDRAKALASDRLHDLDRQELGQWLVWKKREKARRLRELRRKRLELAARQRMQQQQGREEAQVGGQGMTSSTGSSTQQRRPQEEEDMEGDLRGREIRNATSRTHSRTWSGSGLVRGGTDTINGGGGASRRRRARTTTNMLTSDEDDDDDDDDESGSSDDSDSEDDIVGPMDFDSDDGVLLSDSSDYEASDDETPLMKLVSTFDTLHAWISTSSASALSALQDAATLPFSVVFPSANTAPLWRSDNSAPLQQEQQPLDQLQLQLQLQQRQPTRLPFSGAFARIRRRQATMGCRRRLAEIRPRDGLPASLPLRTCGQWIQVINLQQEMPYHQRVMTQSFMQHPATPARGTALRSRAIQLLQLQRQEQQQQGLIGGGGRYGILGSIFQYLTRQQPPGAPIGAASEPERLLSRRDFVNDWTVKTIMDHCPGLCKLTLSECQGVTDRSLELIGDSACVAARTLVSLHLAGCSQITDRGLLGLLGSTRRTLSHRSSPSSSTSSSSSSSSSCPSSSTTLPFPFTFSSCSATTTQSPLRLESLDFAGCYQISDKGLTPLLKQCGSHLLQLRVSDCDNITSASVVALANHCPNTEWLDLCRTGALTEECLILLAERCTDLEWLNLARVSPGVLESSLKDGLGGDGAEGDNTNNGGTGGGIDSDINGEAEIEQDHDEEVIDVDNEKTPASSDGNRLVKEETNTETENQHQDQEEEEEEEKVKEDSITDKALALLCESCPNLQLLDLSYISTISNTAMESLSETAKSLVCLTIIGCPGITSQSLLYLARLRNSSGKLGCITMGDALGISERDIEQIMQGMLSGWQKSLVDETNLGEILGRSWDE